MKLIINAKSLKDILKAVKPWIPKKPFLPILSYIRIDSDDKGTHITAFDSDTAIRFPLEAFPSVYGSCIVKFKDLSDVCTKADGEVTIEYNNIAKLTVSYDQTAFTLKAMPVDEFPSVPNAWFYQKGDESFFTSVSEFTRAVNHMHIATGSDTRKNFTSGILFDIQQGESNVVGTDGRRLHYMNLSGVIADEAWTALVDADVARRISRMKVNANEIQIGKRHVGDTEYFAWEVDCIEGFTRAMDTPYPEWRKVVPVGHSGQIEVDADKLSKSIDRLTPICKSDDGRDMIKVSGNGTLEVSASAESMGSGKSSLETNHIQGDDICVGLNYAFLLDILKMHKSESVCITYDGQLDPIMVKASPSDTRTCVLMPVRLPE